MTNLNTSVTLDNSGNLTQTKDVMGNTTAYTYDSRDRVSTYTDTKGNTIHYSYDALGNITKMNYPDGTTVTYGYSNGKLIKVTEETADGQKKTTKYTRDIQGRITHTVNANGTEEKYTYGENGKTGTHSTYADGKEIRSEVYLYNEDGSIASITVTGGENAASVKASENADTSEAAEKGDGEPESTEKSTGEAAGASATQYRYIQASDKNEASGTGVSYVTTSAKGASKSTTSAAGNNKSKAGEAVQNIYTYGKDNRMETFNGQKVEYDNCGNMTYGPVDGVMTRLVYDSRNRLIKAGNVTYEYDAENVRTATVTKDYREEYITDSTTGLTQVLISTRRYNSGITETRRYVYGNGLISEDWEVKTGEAGRTGNSGNGTSYSINSNGNSHGIKSAENGSNNSNSHRNSYVNIRTGTDTEIIANASAMETNASCYRIYHYNHIGSTVMLTDEDGSIEETYRYSAYGTVLDGNTAITPYLYNGQYGVSTGSDGLNYMRARYYDSVSGRFINRDTVSGTIEDSRSLNRYAYCYGNPVSYADPFGLSPLVSMRNHAVLDVLGMIPGPVGVMADLINAVYYVAEGNVKQAVESVIMSAVSAVPGVMAGKAAGLLGASENTARIVNGIVYASMGSVGVYFGATQVSEDIDRVSANWEYYSTEEKELEAQIFVSHLLGLGGSIAGSVSSAHEVAKADSYRKWEAEVNRLVSGLADDNRGSVDLNALFVGRECDTPSIVEIVDKEKGTFIIKDWSNYPDDYVPVPNKNRVWTLLEGNEYNSARDLANIFNRNMRSADSYYSNNGLEIHEIEPVKMGGSPADTNNKTAIQSQVHRRYVTPWWNKIRDEVKKGLN